MLKCYKFRFSFIKSLNFNVKDFNNSDEEIPFTHYLDPYLHLRKDSELKSDFIKDCTNKKYINFGFEKNFNLFIYIICLLLRN